MALHYTSGRGLWSDPPDPDQNDADNDRVHRSAAASIEQCRSLGVCVVCEFLTSSFVPATHRQWNPMQGCYQPVCERCFKDG